MSADSTTTQEFHNDGDGMKSYQEGSYFVFESVHRIYYSTSKPVPISEVIIALQGLDGILRSVPQVVSAVTGIDIAGGEFLIKSIESGSVVEDIVVKLMFGNKENLDAFIDKIRENKAMRGILISTTIAGLVAYGVSKAVGTGQPAPNITATNSVIINNGAGVVNVSPEAFQAAIADAVKDKKKLAESALKFIGPARSDPGSKITFDPNPEDSSLPIVELPSTFVAEAPARIELATNERLEEYSSVELAIRATNLDSKKNGWAGRLGLREERLPIELDPSIDDRELFGREKVQVSAALVFKEKGKSRELKPARIYVRKILKQ